MTPHRSVLASTWGRTGLLALVCAACSSPPDRAASPTATARPRASAPAPVATPAQTAAPAPAPTPAPAPIAPAEYLRLHNLAADPRQPRWSDALRGLVEAGDGYTLERLRALHRAGLGASQGAELDATIAALAARLPDPRVPPSAAEIQARLERAAWADLRCDRCELTLVPWATKSLADVAADPGVRATLERLRDHYEPAPGFEPDSPWGQLSDRVRKFAGQILQGEGAQQARQSP